MAQDVLLIFDIGKTNKKVLLFDQNLKVLSEEEVIFGEIPDDDGFDGDDIENIEKWVHEKTKKYLEDPDYNIKGINFTTYGATLMYTDESGERVTPIYNYLKPMPDWIVDPLYESHGGVAEFSRKTASPVLGMLNSGLQALWLKKAKPEVWSRVQDILHFPQYMSHGLTGVIASEHTSIGCHTGLWDFDNMKYHDWVYDEELNLPDPLPVEQTYPAKKIQKKVPVGIGIHDSSASLVPYLRRTSGKFLLISTGTWCISMNPFNHTPLTPVELQNDCLAFLSIQQKPVKSSRFFLGHIHDVNLQSLNEHFKMGKDAYKDVVLDRSLIKEEKVFFRDGMPDDFIDREVDPVQFSNFPEAYHQLMRDLTELTVESIKMVIEADDSSENIYITGGFSKNPIFRNLIARSFIDKKVYTSEISNASSLGAALVIWKCFNNDNEPEIDLGLKEVHSCANK
jgi:sugar (pentulose or hexulose) kinase